MMKGQMGETCMCAQTRSWPAWDEVNGVMAEAGKNPSHQVQTSQTCPMVTLICCKFLYWLKREDMVFRLHNGKPLLPINTSN